MNSNVPWPEFSTECAEILVPQHTQCLGQPAATRAPRRPHIFMEVARQMLLSMCALHEKQLGGREIDDEKFLLQGHIKIRLPASQGQSHFSLLSLRRTQAWDGADFEPPEKVMGCLPWLPMLSTMRAAHNQR